MGIEKVNVAIIGGGVVGCAVACELSQSLDGILLIEKNDNIRADNQSSRNSGVIHAGIYYNKRVSPLKARLSVQGNEMLHKFCAEHGVPHRKTGKLLVATDSLEEEYLEATLAITRENNVPDVRKISMDEARDMEPNIHGVSALYVPTSGIVEATSLVSTLYGLASHNGLDTLIGAKVVDIKPSKYGFLLTVEQNRMRETLETRVLVNCAGLYSDNIANIVNPENNYEIEFTKGESAKFYCTRRPEINVGMNIYPAPYGYYNNTGERARVSYQEFLRLLQVGVITRTAGSHLTPTFEGDMVTIGPAKTIGDGKENYRHRKTPGYFHEIISQIFPRLCLGDIELHQAGIMAVLKGHSDWVIERDRKYPNCIQLVGIDSPGLTASLAIGKYVKNLICG